MEIVTNKKIATKARVWIALVLGALALAAPPARAQVDLAWKASITSGGTGEALTKITRDPNTGDVIVGGTVTYSAGGGATGKDFAVAKFRAGDGATLWETRWDSAAHGDDVLTCIAVDPWGNVVAGGNAFDAGGPTSTGSDWAVARFDGETGALVWGTRDDGSWGKNDTVVAIAADNAGSVYIAGTLGGPSLTSDFAVRKYSVGGALRWQGDWSGFGEFDDDPKAFALDASGSSYVAGFTQAGPDATTRDAVVVKWDVRGERLWAAKFDGAGHAEDVFLAVALDRGAQIGDAQTVSVTGFATNANGARDLLAWRVRATDGGAVWTKTWFATGGARGTSVGADGAGNMYIAGEVGSDLSTSAVLLRLGAASGALQWTRTINDAPSERVTLAVLDVDAGGDVTVAGTAFALATPALAVARFDAAGGPLWSRRIRSLAGGANNGDRASGVLVAPDGLSTFVAGVSNNGGAGALDQLAVWKFGAAYQHLPRAVAIGPDNKARILWQRHTDGGFAVWRLSGPGGAVETGRAFTASPGYAPHAFAVGPTDSRARLLLTAGDAPGGSPAALWTMNAETLSRDSGVLFGPVAGYAPQSVAVGADNKARLLWNEGARRRVAVWRVNGTVIEAGGVYGPATGYAPSAFPNLFTVGATGDKPRVVWQGQTSAQIALWTLAPGLSGNVVEAGGVYGPLAGWRLTGAQTGRGDDKTRLVWRSETAPGQIGVWTLAPTGARLSAYAFSAGEGWECVGVAVGPADSKTRLLWFNAATGKTAVWTLTAPGNRVESSGLFGPL